MDKWFHKKSRFVRIILLLIPVCNWIMELGVRWSHAIKKTNALNVIMALLVTFIGLAWGFIDCIWTLFFGRMIGYK